MKLTGPVRIAIIALLLIIIIGIQLALAYSIDFTFFYTRHIFLPLQRWRSFLFNRAGISIGDMLYLLLSLFFLLLLLRTIYFAITFRKNKADFYTELLRLLTFPVTVYLFFLILWGGNYMRPALSANWKMNSFSWDKDTLIRLNMQLLARLNEESRDTIIFPEDEQLNLLLNTAYHNQFGDRLPVMKIKATSLGYMLNYLGIQGYYNPLSGEGQFNRFIPAFMHPFVIAHEMAHQAGIAAEDDANLLAYIVCSESNVLPIRYSAHFNLFLYAFSELKLTDRQAAKEIFDQLNQTNRNNIEELRKMSRKYKSGFRKMSNSLYDEYLRMHGQTEGIDSYSLVTRWAYFWEHCAARRADLPVCP